MEPEIYTSRWRPSPSRCLSPIIPNGSRLCPPRFFQPGCCRQSPNKFRGVPVEPAAVAGLGRAPSRRCPASEIACAIHRPVLASYDVDKRNRWIGRSPPLPHAHGPCAQAPTASASSRIWWASDPGGAAGWQGLATRPVAGLQVRLSRRVGVETQACCCVPFRDPHAPTRAATRAKLSVVSLSGP